MLENNLAGLAVNRSSLRSRDASSNPDWSSSFCTCPCLSLRIRGGMRGTRGARRGPSSKGMCQVQGGCSLREADGRSGGHPMVDRISLSLNEEYKTNVVDNPCRGHTLTEPSHSYLATAGTSAR